MTIEQALIYARLSCVLGVVSLLVYSVFERPRRVMPLVVAMLSYFGVTLANQLVTYFVSYDLSRVVVNIVGTPLLIVVAVLIWYSHR